MTLLDQHRLSNDPDFIGIVHQALLSSATDIVNDGSEDDTPRRTMAVQVLNSAYDVTAPVMLAFVRVAASNPAIVASAVTNGTVDASKVSDNDVLYVVASNWDVIAGQA